MLNEVLKGKPMVLMILWVIVIFAGYIAAPPQQELQHQAVLTMQNVAVTELAVWDGVSLQQI